MILSGLLIITWKAKIWSLEGRDGMYNLPLISYNVNTSWNLLFFFCFPSFYITHLQVWGRGWIHAPMNQSLWKLFTVLSPMLNCTHYNKMLEILTGHIRSWEYIFHKFASTYPKSSLKLFLIFIDVRIRRVCLRKNLYILNFVHTCWNTGQRVILETTEFFAFNLRMAISILHCLMHCISP